MRTVDIEVRHLDGLALDFAVATAEGGQELTYDTVATRWIKLRGQDRALGKGWAQSYTPSSDRVEGGAIIERLIGDGLVLRAGPAGSSDVACMAWLPRVGFFYGATPLLAAMRCHVASRMGERVTVPEAFLGAAQPQRVREW